MGRESVDIEATSRLGRIGLGDSDNLAIAFDLISQLKDAIKCCRVGGCFLKAIFKVCAPLFLFAYQKSEGCYFKNPNSCRLHTLSLLIKQTVDRVKGNECCWVGGQEMMWKIENICAEVWLGGWQSYYKTIRLLSGHRLLPAWFGDVSVFYDTHTVINSSNLIEALLNKRQKQSLALHSSFCIFLSGANNPWCLFYSTLALFSLWSPGIFWNWIVSIKVSKVITEQCNYCA